ncbi:MAG TPA: hypothetical protein VGM93_16090 [Acidimicrobiales bacterium]
MPLFPDTYLVSTTHHLLLLNDRGDVRIVHSGAGPYHGIGQLGDDIYVAARHGILDDRPTEHRAEESGSLLRFGPDLRLRSQVQPADFLLRDLHGVAAAAGKIWAACTFENAIASYDPATDIWDRWYPAPNAADRGRDVHHFNGLAQTPHGLTVVAHAFGASHLQHHDPVTLDLVAVDSLGTEAHDVLDVDDGLAVCSSADGELIATTGWRLRTRGYPRGLARGVHSTAVGISEQTDRGQRAWSTGAVRRYDHDWNHVADHVLPGVGQVLGIHAIDPEALASSGAVDDLAPFDQARTFTDGPGPFEPHDRYDLGDHRCGGPFPDEWHPAEGNLRWASARDARVDLVVNPGEHQLQVDSTSYCPTPRSAEVAVDGHAVGRIDWPEPGEQSSWFALPTGAQGAATVQFSVPELWWPSGTDRGLGVGVRAIRLQA